MSTNAAPAAGDAAYPPELARLEDELVRARRRACGLPLDGPRIGFGLSGGGIRSATFCLGIFQALAKPRDGGKPGPLLGRIDFLSTVSGGGYFGSFLGRLFTRPHVRSVEDASAVLRGAERPIRGQTTFRFLRDSARYVAPLGSGDRLGSIIVTLRNWLVVQAILALPVLALFVALQYADMRLQSAFAPLYGAQAAQPVGQIVTSPWFVWLWPLVGLWALPTAWAYWVIPLPLSTRQLYRRTDLVVLVLIAAASALGWIPPRGADGSWPLLTIVVAMIGVVAAATTVWTVVSNPRAMMNGMLGALRIVNTEATVADSNLSLDRLTRWFKRALIACAIVTGLAIVDSLGATEYAIFMAAGFTLSSSLALGAFLVGIVTVGREQLFVSVISPRINVDPQVLLLYWHGVVALVVVGTWLVALNAASHAVAWQGAKPPYADTMVVVEPVRLLRDADAIVVTAEGDRRILRPFEQQQQPVTTPVTAARSPVFTGRVLLLLLVLVFAVGGVRTLLNGSSLHAFYAQRLARAYLGASNRERLDNDAAHVTHAISGDDLPADHYWNWPHPRRERGEIDAVREFFAGLVHAVRSMFTRVPRRSAEPPVSPARSNAARGAPLHLVSVTINETLDGRSGLERRYGGGVPLAVGPGGLSVGVRHHLIADAEQGFIARPVGDGHAVFDARWLRDEPEVMTLASWATVSGTAPFSMPSPSTTVSRALLATFANKRVGYWWDSGLGRGWTGPLLPVYRGLVSECFARFRGTDVRVWNLTDGGQFENLGGYELIRRRLPLIVLIDAEADPDFEFAGLSELIRKARLDFGAEIRFLDETETMERSKLDVFTSLERLRRGEWNTKSDERAALSAPADRRQYSRAHAALATVTYRDGSEGLIVYVKASLTGHEPVDVLQYHAKHPDFPHETTADQFFDEAQWESYRRLGEVVGETVLTGGTLGMATVTFG
jgi:hypothetical protein